MQIREATCEDAGVVAELITQLGYDTTEAEMHHRLQRIGADEALAVASSPPLRASQDPAER
jgi:hypothetical protein